MLRTAVLALLLFAAAPARAQDAPSDLPDTPVALVFRAWLRAVNSGDSALAHEQALRYEAENPNEPANVLAATRRLLQVGRQLGRVGVEGWQASSPEAMDLVLRAGSGMRLAMHLAVERVGDAWRVADISLRPAGPPQGPQPGQQQAQPGGPAQARPAGPAAQGGPPAPDSLPRGLSDAALADSVAARLVGRSAAGQFDGTVLLARLDGTVLLRRAFGLADRRTNALTTPETGFTLASTGKMFTSIAIAQLVERGRIALDSPLIRYVPDYPNPDFARRATIRHLLSHTSGLGHYWGPEHDARRRSLLRPADYLALFANDPPSFTPGERFQYSNAGFMVLGLVIERVSGLSFYDYVQRNIFDRAGMRHTSYYPASGETPAGVAMGYTGGAPGLPLVVNDTIRELRGGPAGGGYSTVDDMLRFAQALTNGRLVRRQTLAQWTSGQSDNGRTGFGFMVLGEGRAHAFGHNGGAPGMGTWFLVYPEQGLVAVTLTNRDPALMGWIQQPLMRAIAAR